MTDLFEYSTYVEAKESHRTRDEAINTAQRRAVESRWIVERIVSCKDVITTTKQTLVGFEITLLVHREK